MSFYFVMAVLTTHWFADFVLQTDWQAKNKSSNNIALLSHVATYTAAWLVFSLMVPIELLVPWILTNSVLHFITDYTTSRINTQLWVKGQVHNFFVSIGFDQLVHYFCLFGTAVLFGITF